MTVKTSPRVDKARKGRSIAADESETSLSIYTKE